MSGLIICGECHNNKHERCVWYDCTCKIGMHLKREDWDAHTSFWLVGSERQGHLAAGHKQGDVPHT